MDYVIAPVSGDDVFEVDGSSESDGIVSRVTGNDL
jgi:hypothetical protein